MINYDSILSAFDGKPTLLQWLKMVKKALDESVLKDVTIAKDGDNIAFTFNFEDGTSVTTPKVTLPKGDKGDTGTGIVSVTYDHTDIIGDNTETYFKVTLSNGVENTFAVFAKNGKDGINGNDGVSITRIDTVRDEVVGNETLTTLRANYSNDTSNEFVVKAKNGKDATAGGNMYLHSVRIGNSGSLFIYFNIYSSKENITLEDAISQITISGGIPVVLEDSNKNGVLSAKREDSTGKGVVLKGVVYNSSNSKVELYSNSFLATTIKDTLLGVNL